MCALVEYDSDGEDDGHCDDGKGEATPASLVGLKRPRPGEAGVWPTLVYIPLSSSAASASTAWTAAIRAALRVGTPHVDWFSVPAEADDGGRGATDGEARAVSTQDIGLHVSLTRTLPLREAEIEPFVARLRTAMASAPPVVTVTAAGATVLEGDDGRRSFAAIPVVDTGGRGASGGGSRAVGDVWELIRRCDTVATALGHAPFYQVREGGGGAESHLMPVDCEFAH